MQHYFLSFCVFRLFFHGRSFKIFWLHLKTNSLISKFCVNCFLMYYFVNCNNCALKNVNWACYYTCSLVALACLKCVSGLRWLKKPWTSWDHTCHWPGHQLWFRYKWRKLVTPSILLHCIDGYSCHRYWIEFSQLCFKFHIEVSSYCTLTETFAIGFQKRFDHDWVIFGAFCWILPRFVDFISAWTEICMKCSIVILFWRHKFFSVVSSRGFLVCSLKMLVLFRHRIL